MKKLIVASILILSLSTGKAIAAPSHTLIPEFTPGQHIYLDPLIKNHPTASFDFSGAFKNKVDSSNIYVVAAQKGDEPIPESKRLGVAKVDELIAKWAGNAEFNKQDYISIFWVRRADDTSKGAVGANVGAIQRNNGITPSALNEIVATSLKANMPQDPEGAIADIAATIETEIVEYQQEQLRAEQEKEREAEAVAVRKAKTEAFFKSANEFGNNLIKVIFVVSPFGIIGVWLSNRIKRRRDLESQASSLITQWEKVLDNAGTFYTELTEKYLGELEVLDIAKCDETFQLTCQKAIGEVAFFMDMKQQGDLVIEDANINLSVGDFGNVVHLLTENEIEVTGEKVPLSIANLLTGPNRVATCKASDFLEQLNAQFELAKNDLIFILDQYNSVGEKYRYLETLFKTTEDYLTAKVHTKDSYFELNGIEIKNYSIDVSEGSRLLVLAKVAFEQFNVTKLATITDLLIKWSDEISNIKKKAIATYDACEKSFRHLPSSEYLQYKLTEAEQACTLISQQFPSYKLNEFTDALNGYKIDIAKYADCWPKMKSLYEQADFEALLGLIRIYQDMCDRLSTSLDVIVHKPTELKNLQSIKVKYLQEQKRKANKLRRYNWDSRAETQVNQYLAIGDFTQAEAMINSLDSEIACAKRSEDSTYSSSYSSSGSSSSSSDYGSSSSSSDYGSSSSSSDYGSSSGGSDY